MMRELIGKAFLCTVAFVFGMFLGTRLYWVGAPPLVSNGASLLCTLGIGWFLLNESRPTK